jgi:hypothetical protein
MAVASDALSRAPENQEKKQPRKAPSIGQEAGNTENETTKG